MNVQAVTAQIKSFPSMPNAALRLLDLLEQPDASPLRIEQELRLDPGLTANVLRMTNSVFFGLPARVGSVRKAVTLLGTQRLRQLVMTSCVNAVMEVPIPGYELPPGELWRHSIAVSMAAEDLLRVLALPPDDEIFTAALLHDVGKMVLGGFVEARAAEFARAMAAGTAFEAAEQKILGVTHADAGAQILEVWQLPAKLVRAVRWHHDPEGLDPPETAVDLVHVANVLCLMIGVGMGREGLAYAPSKGATRRLGLHTSHLETVASRLLQWVEEFSAAVAGPGRGGQTRTTVRTPWPSTS